VTTTGKIFFNRRLGARMIRRLARGDGIYVSTPPIGKEKFGIIANGTRFNWDLTSIGSNSSRATVRTFYTRSILRFQQHSLYHKDLCAHKTCEYGMLVYFLTKIRLVATTGVYSKRRKQTGIKAGTDKSI
jgi:hypothetical protein